MLSVPNEPQHSENHVPQGFGLSTIYYVGNHFANCIVFNQPCSRGGVSAGVTDAADNRVSDGVVNLSGSGTIATLGGNSVSLGNLNVGNSFSTGIVNQSGYFDRLLDFLHHASAEGFVRGSLGDLLLVEPDPEALLRRLQRLVPDDPAPGAQPQSPPR